MLLRQASRAMLHNTVLAPLAGAVTLLATVVLTRRLSLEAYGIYAIVTSLAYTVLVYGDLGVSTGIAKFLPEMVEREGRAGVARLIGAVVAARAALFTVIGLVLAAAPAPWVRLFGLGAGREFLLGYVGVIVLLEGVATTFLHVLAARFQPRLVNVVLTVYGAAQAALLLLATAGGRGLAGVLPALVAGLLVKLALSGALVWREVRRVPDGEQGEERPWQGRFLKVSLSSYFEKVATWLHSPAFLTLVLAATTGTAEVAIFALAGEFVVRALSFALNPTNGVILPAFAVAFARGEESARRVFRYTIRLLTVLAISALVVLLAITADLLQILYSSRYAAAAPVAMVLLVFYFIEYTIYAPANAALLAGERLRAYFVVKGISVALALLYLVLRPATLLEWAVLMGVLRLLTALLLLGAATSTHRLTYPGRSLRIFAAGGLVATGLWAQGWLLPLAPLPHVIAAALLGGLGMVVALRAFGAFDEEDRRLVRSTGLPFAQAVARIM